MKMAKQKEINSTKALELLHDAISKGKTAYRIAKETKLTENTITNYVKGRTRPTNANSEILIKYFLEDNRDKNSKETDEAKSLQNINYKWVSMVPISARAGYLQGYGDETFIESLPQLPVLADREYKGKYRIFEVSGDSMFDGSVSSFCDKDKVLCREVRQDLWKYKLHYKDWFFVIAHKEEGILLKQITNHDVERGIITCHSLNDMYDDLTINLDDVAELYNIVRIIERNPKI